MPPRERSGSGAASAHAGRSVRVEGPLPWTPRPEHFQQAYGDRPCLPAERQRRPGHVLLRESRRPDQRASVAGRFLELWDLVVVPTKGSFPQLTGDLGSRRRPSTCADGFCKYYRLPDWDRRRPPHSHSMNPSVVQAASARRLLPAVARSPQQPAARYDGVRAVDERPPVTRTS